MNDLISPQCALKPLDEGADEVWLAGEKERAMGGCLRPSSLAGSGCVLCELTNGARRQRVSEACNQQRRPRGVLTQRGLDAHAAVIERGGDEHERPHARIGSRRE